MNVQDQPKSVATSVNEFVKVLIEAVVIVLAVSFISLGLHKRPGNHPLWKRWYIDPRPGLVVAITIVSGVDYFFGQRHGAGRDHAAANAALVRQLGRPVERRRQVVNDRDAVVAKDLHRQRTEFRRVHGPRRGAPGDDELRENGFEGLQHGRRVLVGEDGQHTDERGEGEFLGKGRGERQGTRRVVRRVDEDRR